MYYLLIILMVFLADLQGQLADTTLIESQHDPFSLPVDITFLIADLKYNAKQGVKICEIQPGSMSGFYSKDDITPEVDFFYGPDGELANIFCKYLSQYVDHFWLIDAPIDSMLKKKLMANGWIKFATLNELKKDSQFAKIAKISPRDPSNLNAYHGVVYASYEKIAKAEVDEFVKNNPGIILLDASIYPYVNNKLAISDFLSKNELSRNLKPRWKSYPKEYSKTLAETIFNDLNCEFFVIKPINSLQGRGVIVIHKNDLDSTLKLIFGRRKVKHKAKYPDSLDSALNYWKKDFNAVFIVEEFIESDPIMVAHLNNQVFDATMRVAFFLTYSQGKVEMYFVGQEWQLPEYALTAEVSMTQKHKSSVKIPYFAGVDPEILHKVQEQLREGIPIFYKQMLGIN